jgi:sterol desaturase/sphingolipid hydroxylase (fatty acid hydroxylase superfamily)
MAYGIALFMGALAWTLLEYVLHRFAGHEARGRNHFSREHLRHHGTPDYFSPLWQKLLSAIVAVPVAGGTWALLAGIGPGIVFGLAFGAMYAVYEWLHKRLHTHAPRGVYGRWARRHHFHHHFGDSEQNHGVTSPIWDIVFNTHAPVQQVAVPRKRAMRWLTDRDGRLHPEHAGEYQLTDGRMARA